MAGKGLVIPLSLNPRDWITGIRRVEDTLEDFEDNLEDVEDAGARLGRKLEDVFDEAARDADRAGRDMSDNFETGTSRVGGIGGEVAEEFTQNFGEAVRSGNPADAVLETFTSLGPALGALGLGAALVAGIVNGINEERKRVQGAISSFINDDMADALSRAQDSGRSWVKEFNKGVVDEATKIERLQEFYGVDTMQEALARAADQAETAGLRVTDIVDAIGATGKEQETANAKLERAQQYWEDQYDASVGVVDSVGNINGALQAQNTRAAKALEVTEDVGDAADNIQTGWKNAKKAIREYERDADAATKPRTQVITIKEVKGARGRPLDPSRP